MLNIAALAKRKVGIITILLVIVVCVVLQISYVFWGIHRRFEMIDVVNTVHHALYQYSSDQPAGVDQYPADLADLVGTKWLETMPASPYTGRKMHVLEEGAPPRRGCIRYEIHRTQQGVIWACTVTLYGASTGDTYSIELS